MANSYPNEPMLLSNLGIALHLSSQDEEAVSPLRKATEAMPESFQAHFFLGASLTRLGLYKEAISPLRQSGKLDANNPFVPALLADALEATGQFQAAINSWLALQGIDETNSFAYAGLLRCYENLAAQAVERPAATGSGIRFSIAFACRIAVFPTAISQCILPVPAGFTATAQCSRGTRGNCRNL